MSSEHETSTRSGLAHAAARYGLVRPLQGRYVAGVCGAVGRATGTDPVLWRVVLAVLVCFGGVGLLAYLLLWLTLPEEGDTASPIESLFGQGRSATSSLLAIVLIALIVVTLVVVTPRVIDAVLFGAALALGGVLLVQQQAANARRDPGAAGPGGGPSGGPPPGPPPGTPPGPPPGTPAGPSPSSPAGPSGEDQPAGQPTPGAPVTSGAGDPAATAQTATASPATETVPRPSAWSSVTAGEPGPSPGAATAAGPPPWSEAPTVASGPVAGPPAGSHRRLPMLPIAFFATLTVLGALRILELAGVVDVPLAGYVAAALAVVGAGLVAGAWLGGARSLIVPGLVLALVLPVAHAFDTYRADHVGTQVTWTPTDVTDLADRYEVRFGDGLLDLRQVDFAG